MMRRGVDVIFAGETLSLNNSPLYELGFGRMFQKYFQLLHSITNDKEILVLCDWE